MKYVLASLLLFPGLAFAASGIRCTTQGSLGGDVVLTITSADTMLGWPVRAKVEADGFRHTDIDVTASLISLDALGPAKIALKEVDPQTGLDLVGGTQAELSVTVDTIGEGINAVLPAATLNITQRGRSARFFSSAYDLANCRGVL